MTFPTLPSVTGADVWGATINQALNHLNTALVNQSTCNVKNYGALGDAATDDTAAIAAAFAAANGRPVYFPAGTYLTDQITLTGTVITSTVNIVGDGRNTTTLRKRTADGNPLLQMGATSPAGYQASYTVTGITFQGQAGNTPAVAKLTDVVRSTWRECKFTSGLIGVQLRGGISNHFVDCDISGNVDGFSADSFVGGIGGYPNLTTLSQCEITSNTGWGVKFSGGRSLAVLDCDIEQNGTNGTADSGGLFVGTTIGSEGGTVAFGVTAQRCWFEANAGGAVVSLGSGRNKFDTCYFVANPNATNDVIVNGGRYVFVDCDTDTNKAVSFNETAGASSPNSIINCDFVGGVTIDATKTLRFGSASGWDTFTPTVGGTGWALGDGTLTGRYKRVDKTVFFEIIAVWGAASTFGASALTFNLPTTKAAANTSMFVTARFRDASAGAQYVGAGEIAGSGTVVTPRSIANATGQVVGVTTSVPFAWATTDSVTISGHYETT